MFIENVNIQGLADMRSFKFSNLEGAELCEINLSYRINKPYKDIYQVILEEKENHISYKEIGNKSLITAYGNVSFKMLLVLENNTAEVVICEKPYSFSYLKVKKKLLKIEWLDLKLSFFNNEAIDLYLVGASIFETNNNIDLEEKVFLKDKNGEENNIYFNEEFF